MWRNLFSRISEQSEMKFNTLYLADYGILPTFCDRCAGHRHVAASRLLAMPPLHPRDTLEDCEMMPLKIPRQYSDCAEHSAPRPRAQHGATAHRGRFALPILAVRRDDVALSILPYHYGERRVAKEAQRDSQSNLLARFSISTANRVLRSSGRSDSAHIVSISDFLDRTILTRRSAI